MTEITINEQQEDRVAQKPHLENEESYALDEHTIPLTQFLEDFGTGAYSYDNEHPFLSS